MVFIIYHLASDMIIILDERLYGGDLFAEMWVRHNGINYSYQR